MNYLVAVDGSAYSDKALGTVLQLATPEKDNILLISCVEEISSLDMGDEEVVIIAAEQIKNANNDLQDNALKALEDATKICKDAGFTADSIVTSGNPRDKIIDIAKERHIDMIVLGSRGLGTLSRILLGSVSDYIVKNAPCSVLVIRDTHGKSS